ncbi:12632_t:CDS:2, partial [Cetraspora pellucida]
RIKHSALQSLSNKVECTAVENDEQSEQSKKKTQAFIQNTFTNLIENTFTNHIENTLTNHTCETLTNHTWDSLTNHPSDTFTNHVDDTFTSSITQTNASDIIVADKNTRIDYSEADSDSCEINDTDDETFCE